MKNKIFAAFIIGAFALPALAKVTSGLKPGERVTPFHPKHIAGPLANSTNCFPCTFQNRPQTQVWITGDDVANVKSIARALDSAMSKYGEQEFKGLIVLVASGDAEKLEKLASAASKEKGLSQVGIAVIGKDDSAVKHYKINTDGTVKNTVLVYRNWKVTKSFVNLKADAKGLGELDSAIAEAAK